VVWIDVTQVMNQWRALVNMVMGPRLGPIKREIIVKLSE
jgi:hypothetical protein